MTEAPSLSPTTVPYEVFQREREQRIQAERTLENHRHTLEGFYKIIHQSNTKMSPGEKLLLIAARCILPDEKRDPNGFVRLPYDRAANFIGMSESSANRYGNALTDRFGATKESVPYTTLKGQDCILTYIDPSDPLWTEPWNVDLPEEKERIINGNLPCPHCKSEGTYRVVKKRVIAYQEIRKCSICNYNEVSEIIPGYGQLPPTKKALQAGEPFGETILSEEEEQGNEKAPKSDTLTSYTGVESAPGEISKKGLQPEEPFGRCASTPAFEELKALKIWCPWRFVPQEDKPDKPKKVPYQTRGRDPQWAKPNDPATWTTYESALATYQEYQSYKNPYDGIGFMNTGEYVQMDLDKCRDPETGELTDEAAAMVARFAETYWEISQSGTGLHSLSHGTLPAGVHESGVVELYPNNRFFVWTGHHLEGTSDSIGDCQGELNALYSELRPARGEEPAAHPARDDVELDDQALQAILEKVRNGKNGAKYCALLEGKWEEAGYRSQSEADAALCNELAYRSDNNVSAIDRLFRTSALMRDKWDRSVGRGETYGQRTIRLALVRRKEQAA